MQMEEIVYDRISAMPKVSAEFLPKLSAEAEFRQLPNFWPNAYRKIAIFLTHLPSKIALKIRFPKNIYLFKLEKFHILTKHYKISFEMQGNPIETQFMGFLT